MKTHRQAADVHSIAPVKIDGRQIGPGYPCLVIAEAGVNHNGNLDTAFQLVDAAAKAGADVVKFQTFKTELLVTRSAPKAAYQCRTTSASESQFDMLKKLELSYTGFRELMRYCVKKGIMFLSTPFDEESAAFLHELGVAAFKVGSGELTNLPLLDFMARKQLPMIVSTGMASLVEVNTAVQTMRQAGNDRLILLHCVSNYPADPASVNLRAMQTLAESFHTPVGYSDHTLGIEVATAAVALGACVIEKHFTLDRLQQGPDHRTSSEPAELAGLIRAARNVEKALGHGFKRPAPSESSVAKAARKSLIAARDLAAGAVMAAADIVIRRPGTGLPPAWLPKIAGCRLRVDVVRGTPLQAEMFGMPSPRETETSVNAPMDRQPLSIR